VLDVFQLRRRLIEWETLERVTDDSLGLASVQPLLTGRIANRDRSWPSFADFRRDAPFAFNLHQFISGPGKVMTTLEPQGTSAFSYLNDRWVFPPDEQLATAKLLILGKRPEYRGNPRDGLVFGGPRSRIVRLLKRAAFWKR